MIAEWPLHFSQATTETASTRVVINVEERQRGGLNSYLSPFPRSWSQLFIALIPFSAIHDLDLLFDYWWIRRSPTRPSMQKHTYEKHERRNRKGHQGS